MLRNTKKQVKTSQIKVCHALCEYVAAMTPGCRKRRKVSNICERLLVAVMALVQEGAHWSDKVCGDAETRLVPASDAAS